MKHKKIFLSLAALAILGLPLRAQEVLIGARAEQEWGLAAGLTAGLVLGAVIGLCLLSHRRSVER